MSEYQYYEFRAIDRALTKKRLAELRAISTRAVITPTSFTNHYEWGDLKADPVKLLEKYFDAYVHFTNFGFAVFGLRLPLAGRRGRIQVGHEKIAGKTLGERNLYTQVGSGKVVGCQSN